jgi:hypothetical protein
VDRCSNIGKRAPHPGPPAPAAANSTLNSERSPPIVSSRRPAARRPAKARPGDRTRASARAYRKGLVSAGGGTAQAGRNPVLSSR